MRLYNLIHHHIASYWVCIRHYHMGTGVPHTKLERAGEGGGEKEEEEIEEIEERGKRRKKREEEIRERE